MFNEASLNEFRQGLRGRLVEPQDEGYDDARKVYNAMISKRPRLIAYCVDVADVVRCVNFARENNLLISVRGGGHNAGGLGICDDGLVVDLSGIRYTNVDPESKTVVVGGGSLWGDVDHATSNFGLAVPSGIISTTGVGGLTLGGGLGHLTRQFGLTIDNLLSVDMVLADGRFVKANAKENPDLFWAVRGGGGNFGIVTAFTYKLHNIGEIYAGPIFYELEEAEEVLKWYNEFMKNGISDELNGFFAFLTIPPAPMFPEKYHMKKMCGVFWCHTGSGEKAEKVFKKIREFKKPAIDLVGPVPLPALQSLFDAIYPAGLQWYWKADYVNDLNDAAIRKHLEFGKALPTWQSTMHLYPVNGAASKVSKKDTAWNYRSSTWAMVIVGVDSSPSNKEIVSWATKYWEAMHPFSAGGAYVNFMMEEGEDRVKATYGDNYERLVAVKKKYDPKNFFRVNQNIKP